MSGAFTIRPAKTSDLGAVAGNVVEGLPTYRGLDAGGAEPAGADGDAERPAAAISRDGSWGHVACQGTAPAGHIMIRPDCDDESRRDVALLTRLFVRERHWGSGLAQQLHAVGVAAMAAHGSRRASARRRRPRRARAFYARRGWQPTGEPETSGEHGLGLAEYVLLGLRGSGAEGRGAALRLTGRRARGVGAGNGRRGPRTGRSRSAPRRPMSA